MRKAKYAVPIWPYIGAVTCLFVLTLLAPITWQNVATSRPATWSPAGRHLVPLAPQATVATVEPSQVVPPAETTFGEKAATNEPEPSRLIAIFPAPRAGVKVLETWKEPAVVATVTPAPSELSGFAAPRQHAVAAPPVADRITLRMEAPDGTTGHMLPGRNYRTPASRIVAISTSTDPRAHQQRAPALSATPHGWPHAVTLIESFRTLEQVHELRDWAASGIKTLEAVRRLDGLDAPEMASLLNDLGHVAQQGIVLAENAKSPELRSDIRRAGYATVRRELLWRQVYQVATSNIPVHRVSNLEAKDRLKEVRAMIGSNANAKAWEKYLRLNEIQIHLQHASADVRAELAHDVLSRMTSPKLTAAQRAVLRDAPFSDLERELRRWVVEPIAYPRLLDDIELYEQTRAAAAAHRIADCYQVIRWSEDPSIAKLARHVDAHYRNANLRVAVRDDLLNRLLPQQDDFEEEVNEQIIGAQVFGNAQGSAHMRTVLIPDPRRWRFGLEVEGEVESQTSATRGPATFFNDGYSRYQARKLFQIDHRGVVVSDSEAEANMNSQLTGFRTLFDSLPILGWVARGIARQQHDDSTEMARWVSETRLETRMRERLDSEVQTQLEEAQTTISRKIVAPLQQLDLNPSAVEMRTTKDRLIARYRLASDHQIGAFTPRPQAPSDSMLSVQVHETMLNNTLEQLGLDGRRTKLHQLYRDLADAFDRTDLEVPDDIPENVTVQFADHDPVRVHCQDGKLTLTLHIAELKNRHNAWHHFKVRAEYIPDATDVHANLVRDGIVQLIGDRLSFGDQIVLRTIFSRTLSKNQPFNVINKKLAEHPAIADLNVNQFVIEDGWIGAALGPHRVAARPIPATSVVR